MRNRVYINKWNRKLAYNTFSNYLDPYTGLVTKLDVTNLVNFCKTNNISYYTTMAYFVLKVMSSIEAFKYGYGKENGEEHVDKFSSIAVTDTVINSDNELNFTRYVEFNEEFLTFAQNFTYAISEASNNVPYYKIDGQDYMNKVNITCIPWLSFSNFKDAINFNEKNSKPKLCWRKYYLEDDKYIMDISLLVNHAFQDGYHIGLFFNTLQENIFKLLNDKILTKSRGKQI